MYLPCDLIACRSFSTIQNYKTTDANVTYLPSAGGLGLYSSNTSTISELGRVDMTSTRIGTNCARIVGTQDEYCMNKTKYYHTAVIHCSVEPQRNKSFNDSIKHYQLFRC